MTEESQIKRYSFDEYKMYYESAEKTTDRRLAMNSWNYGICTAVIAGMAILWNWSASRAEFKIVALCASAISALMGNVLCVLWVGQIRDFKNLNNAKFEVLNFMAEHIYFGDGDDRTSAAPFKREWDILKKNEATQEISSMKLVALRSSDIELFVPNAFRWIFLIVAFASILSTIARTKP